MTFRDCPEAYQELLSVRGLYVVLRYYLSTMLYAQEISNAKNELRMHGVSVD